MSSDKRPAIQWGRAFVDWDGEKYDVMVTSFLPKWPSAWLERNLDERIAHLFDDFVDPPTIVVVPAVWYGPNDDTSGVRDVGEIRFLGMAEQWPDADKLREEVEKAADEAWELSRHADRVSREFRKRLAGSVE